MYSLRIVNSEQTKSLLSMEQAVADVALAYELFAEQAAGVFPVIVHQFEKGKREMDLKSGHLAGAGVFGMKMLGFCSENSSRGLPPLSGLIAVMDVDRQCPIGIVDGTPITFMRTGAAGGVAARTFARKNSKRAFIIGAGNQGRAQLLGLVTAMPTLEEIYVADRTDAYSLKFVEEQRTLFPTLKFVAVPYKTLKDELCTADIIVTCTRAESYFLKKEWVRPGTHINAIGTDMPGKQEIDPMLMKRVKLFADSRSQVVEKGECQYIAKQGELVATDIDEIGEVLIGKKEGRISDDEITLFDATGMAIQDLIVASKILEQANKLDIGITVEF